MNELFGLPMNTIMYVLVGLFVLSLLGTALLFLRRGKAMLRLGLRNAARRRAQSVLVTAGLTLGTVVVTAAFTTGDTLDYSITRVAYDFLQRTDISLHHIQSPEQQAGDGDQFYANQALAARLQAAFANDPDIEGFMPFLFEFLPVRNGRTNLVEPTVIVAGLDAASLDRFGGLRTPSGSHVDLAALGEDEVFANERAVKEMGVKTGDTLTIYAGGQEFTLRVAGIVQEERASGGLEFGGGEQPGLAAKLSTVQRITGREGLINSISVVLRGGVRGTLDRSVPAAERLKSFVATPEGKAQLGLGTAGFQVEEVKRDAIESAELNGSIFTTIFLVLGLFAIAAGILLIFMIFVMLAAERRQEMGIARAIGAERIHLVQAFLAEGMLYGLLAGLIGVALGVAFGLLVIVTGARLAFGDSGSFIAGHVTARTLVVSFCLGTVITFLTVVASSLYVSRLNIVAAVRGQSEPARRSKNGQFSLKWLLISLLLLLPVPPLGVYWLLHRGFGIPRDRALTWLGLVGGAAAVAIGRLIGNAFLFYAGISALLAAGAVLLGAFGIPGRVRWSVFAVLLGLFWLLPFGLTDVIFGEFEGSTGMEMFVLSGIMIVTAFTVLIVHNARLMTLVYRSSGRGLQRWAAPLILGAATLALALIGVLVGTGGGGAGNVAYLMAMVTGVLGAFALLARVAPSLAPALKMGVAYPLASPFRTGLTIAMIALILFSITVMSVINASFLDLFSGEEADGGWDLLVATNRNNAIDDLPGSLTSAGEAGTASQITAVGRTSGFDDDRSSVRTPPAADAPAADGWSKYIVGMGDSAFWSQSQIKLGGRARGYPSDADVFEAIRTEPGLAVIDSSAVVAQTFGGGVFRAEGVTIDDEQFDAFPIEIRNEATGKVVTVTVIGVVSARIPAGLLPALLVSERSHDELFGSGYLPMVWARLQDPGESAEAARVIRSSLVTSGVDALSIREELDNALGTSRAFMRVIQAFMGLGLLVGIAAIGVIAMRSVVERRQQIGMLRAIGYERSTVALSFLFETAFIALMGIGSGLIGAIILSRNLITSEDFSGARGVAMFVPWPELIGFTVIALVFSLLMTWWPSRNASRVPIAEALRYE